MKIRTHEIDSQLLGGPVLEIEGLAAETDFAELEARYRLQYQPRYVVCRMPVENLTGIHRLETHGFRFIEFQIRSELRLRRRYDPGNYPYAYELVTGEMDLEAVQDIAGATFTDDRFTADPDLPPGIGGERYRRFVQKSHIDPQELVHKLVNLQSGEILGFNTCRLLSPTEALLLIAGVKPEYKASGLGTLLNYYAFNDLLERGIHRIRTHHSGRNYPILNVELGHFGFRVLQTFVVLRKLY